MDLQGLVEKWRNSRKTLSQSAYETDVATAHSFGCSLMLGKCTDELAEVIGRNVPDATFNELMCWSCWPDKCKDCKCKCHAESRPVQQPAQLIAAQQAEDEGLWCIPKTAMEGHLQKELRRLTEAVEGKTSAECLRELLLKPPVQQPATEPDERDWDVIHTFLESWEKIWQAERSKFSADYPKWMIDAATELFAHDMCDAWVWSDYVKAACVIIARHVPVGTGPDEEAEFKNWAFPADGDGTRFRNFAAYEGAHDGWMARAALAVRAVPVGTGWISVEEKLPEPGVRVLIWLYEGAIDGYRERLGEISCGHWRPEGGNGNFDKQISHWQPLPASPLAHSPEAKESK